MQTHPSVSEPHAARNALLDGVSVALMGHFTETPAQLAAAQRQHAHSRLGSVMQDPRLTLGDDEDGIAALDDTALRPNPVTLDEVDAGAVERL